MNKLKKKMEFLEASAFASYTNLIMDRLYLSKALLINTLHIQVFDDFLV
jgi:hypothetical protein